MASRDHRHARYATARGPLKYTPATVSRVEVSADLHHARAFVSLLGSEDERAACLQALRGAGGYLRSKLGARLRLRTTPELAFEIDRGPEHSMKIAEILEGLDHHHEEP